MAAPVVKGLIITASVLMAAGIAFMENDQIREWILQSRERIAMALHSIGDDISPTFLSEDDDAAWTRRQEIIRRNRLELLRQAREEGIAIDLDEFAAIGQRRAQNKSFDDMVLNDGTLKPGPEIAKTSGAASTAEGAVRRRGAGSRGLDMGSAFANPFDDEAQVMFDRDLIGAEEENERECRESTRTLTPDPFATSTEYFSEEELEAQIQEAIRRSLSDDDEAIRRSLEDVDAEKKEVSVSDPPTSVPGESGMSESEEDLYYYAPPSQVSQPPASHQSMFASALEDMMAADLQTAQHDNGFEEDESYTPPGTMTPTDDGYSMAASVTGSVAGDIASMSDFHSVADEASVVDADEEDARLADTAEAQQPIFSSIPENHDEAMSDTGYSTDTYSLVGAGTSTPGSWSDVGSEAGDEEGFQGQVNYSQSQQPGAGAGLYGNANINVN